MYEFCYDYIKDKSSSNSRLLFTDTDSLMYDIITEDVYKKFTKDEQCLILVIIQLNQIIMMIQEN